VLGLTGGTTGAATQTYAPRDCIHEAVKPHRIVITCADGNFYVAGLHWSSWKRKSASATGTAHINDCVPFCAHGHFHTYPVSVRLSSAHFCADAGVTQFRRMRVTFTGRSPTGLRQTESEKLFCPTT
jgi:hypothetical protein